MGGRYCYNSSYNKNFIKIYENVSEYPRILYPLINHRQPFFGLHHKELMVRNIETEGERGREKERVREREIAREIYISERERECVFVCVREKKRRLLCSQEPVLKKPSHPLIISPTSYCQQHQPISTPFPCHNHRRWVLDVKPWVVTPEGGGVKVIDKL